MKTICLAKRSGEPFSAFRVARAILTQVNKARVTGDKIAISLPGFSPNERGAVCTLLCTAYSQALNKMREEFKGGISAPESNPASPEQSMILPLIDNELPTRQIQNKIDRFRHLMEGGLSLVIEGGGRREVEVISCASVGERAAIRDVIVALLLAHGHNFRDLTEEQERPNLLVNGDPLKNVLSKEPARPGLSAA